MQGQVVTKEIKIPVSGTTTIVKNGTVANGTINNGGAGDSSVNGNAGIVKTVVH